jgi:hypothetical protein
MEERPECADCKAQSPKTETNYTLISTGPDGQLRVEWRCPSCWRAFKQAHGIESPPRATISSVDLVKPTSGTHAVEATQPHDDDPTLDERPDHERRRSQGR